MTAASRRARRPSALQAVGNPADVAPSDTAGDIEHQADEDAARSSAAVEPSSPAPDDESTPTDSAEPTDAPSTPEKPATARRGRRKAEAPAPAGESTTAALAASTGTPKRPTRTRAKAGKGAEGSEAIKADVAETAGRADSGRPRVPRQGPVTRMSLDLAVSETRELERIAGTIGRDVGRAGGRSRLRVQHLARVAVRRLITDAEFRALVTDDFRHGRDELRRPD